MLLCMIYNILCSMYKTNGNQVGENKNIAILTRSADWTKRLDVKAEVGVLSSPRPLLLLEMLLKM